MFHWRERVEPTVRRFGVDWGFTDRHGGRSRPPFAALNLGLGVGDDPDAVRANAAAVAAALDLPPQALVFMHQVHGARVVDVAPPRPGEPVVPERCDAQVTASPDLALAVLVADCTPVLVVDRDRGLLAVAHAGRLGMVEGVVEQAVHALRERGARAPEAVVGPSICPRCYEVPLALREEVAARVPVARAVSWTGTPALDVASGVVEQLTRLGVPHRWLGGGPREHPDLTSHRGGDPVGRYAGVARLLAPTGAAA